MKRFVIPALFVIDVDETKPEEMFVDKGFPGQPNYEQITDPQRLAEAIAAKMQADCNHQTHAPDREHLLLDEGLPTLEIPINPEETELPHSYIRTAT